jgi:hypothetical protein
VANLSPVGPPEQVSLAIGPAGVISSIGDDRYDYCFAAGTLVLMADHPPRKIEEMEERLRVLAVPDRTPESRPAPCHVVEVFRNAPAVIWHVRVGGGLIRTTANHPFYVRNRGWMAAEELAPGDLLRTHDSTWAEVHDVVRTGLVEPVFNLRVEGNPTYFVWLPAAGVAVLVHNQSAVAAPVAAPVGPVTGVTVAAPPAPGTPTVSAPASGGSGSAAPATPTATAASAVNSVAVLGAAMSLRAQGASWLEQDVVKALNADIASGNLTFSQACSLYNTYPAFVNSTGPAGCFMSMNAQWMAARAGMIAAKQASGMQSTDHHSPLSPAQVAALNAASTPQPAGAGAGVPPAAPPAVGGAATQPSSRPVHGGEAHDRAINDRLDSLPENTRNALKNKGQVTADGKVFSNVRPDGQWTDANGVRHYHEVSSKTSQADPARLRANDPDGIIEVLNLDTGKTVVYHPGDPIP